MLIKQQALKSHLNQRLVPLYVLFGQDYFLLNKAAEDIKLAWKTQKKDELEESTLTINNPSDWVLLAEEANSYSLFANETLIDIRYEKKTIEAAGKTVLLHYLENTNPSCLLLLRAPSLTQKQIQWLTSHEKVLVVQASPLNSLAMQHWIIEQLNQKELTFEQQVPALIHRYTQGNMLACAQVIEKLALIADADTLFTTTLVKEQLVDQSDYQLFELADACLSQNPDKVIQLLRYACHSKVEPVLVLWLLTQEIRVLTQLLELTNHQRLSFNVACGQLKIWPQKANAYQHALKRWEPAILSQLLQDCKLIDERIKSNHNTQVWHFLEQVALSLCLAKKVGNRA